ncbi:MAG: glycosyltransferase family 4 protein [Bacteroidota bacterium]
MKILHFSSALSWRGGEQQIAYLYEELAAKGIKQWIFCVQKSALAAHCLQNNIPHFTYQKRFSVNPIVAFQLKKIIQQQSIDLVHLHDAHAHTFAFMSTFLGVKNPFVLSRRVDFPVKNNWLSIRKYNHPAIKKIISVSRKVQEVLAPAISDKEKLIVIHSGIDIEKFQFSNANILRNQYLIPSKVPIIANVAALAAHKDYYTFVDTAAVLLHKNPSLKFLIIGADGGEAANISNYIAQKELEKDIILTGFRTDISQILLEIDVFLFTSKEEGLGTAVLDALASGVPVVATAAGGVPEIIEDGVNGFLVPIGAAEELARKVVHLLKDSETRQRFIQHGKETTERFSKRRMAEETLKMYQMIVEQ